MSLEAYVNVLISIWLIPPRIPQILAVFLVALWNPENDTVPILFSE